MMVGTWQWSNGSSEWEFLDDGTIDDGWGNSKWWSVNGNFLVYEILNTYDERVQINLYVKEVCENGYLLVEENGTLYATMYVID